MEAEVNFSLLRMGDFVVSPHKLHRFSLIRGQKVTIATYSRRGAAALGVGGEMGRERAAAGDCRGRRGHGAAAEDGCAATGDGRSIRARSERNGKETRAHGKDTRQQAHHAFGGADALSTLLPTLSVKNLRCDFQLCIYGDTISAVNNSNASWRKHGRNESQPIYRHARSMC